jgi:hypothetical protein
VVDRRARRAYYQTYMPADLTYTHGEFFMVNGSTPFIPISGVLGQGNAMSYEMQHIVKGKILHIPLSPVNFIQDSRQDVSVIPLGRGIANPCHSGRFSSSFRFTQPALHSQIYKTGIFNSWLWSCSRAVLMPPTERQVWFFQVELI